MESLPPEMVEEVCQYLTHRDLSSCAAVSRRWREVFNHESLWRQHCDPSLVEPLEKTPSVVEPRFVSPEVESSTLDPISHWRLAFLRQQHLWTNWEKGNREIDVMTDHCDEIEKVILSNNLLVTCFEERIEVWDIGTFPGTLIARRNLEDPYYCRFYRANQLIVNNKDSLKVFHLDPLQNNVIELVHDVSIESHEPTNFCEMEQLTCVNGSIYIHVNADKLSLDVIDLDKGMKIKTESCPVTRKENQNATIVGSKSSPNSDYVMVIVKVPWSDEEYHFYTYSLGQLVFSSGPIVKHRSYNPGYFVINGDHLAFSKGSSLEIYNCLTSELLSESSSHRYEHPRVFNDGFVCLVINISNGDRYIRMYSLTNNIWTTIDYPSVSGNVWHSLEIINNKFINCTDFFCSELVWEASGQTLRRTDIPGFNIDEINKSFTRGVSHWSEEILVYYYW